jgi:hypothetical protein
MIPIAIAVSIAFLCLALFVAFFAKREAGPAKNSSEQHCPAIMGLSGSFEYFDTVFSCDDYNKLRARPELGLVLRQYRRDRRRIALMCLGELATDVRLLWEFRRFMVCNGLPVSLREELAVGFLAFSALLCLNFARMIVVVLGPFSLAGVLRLAKLPVERLSSHDAILFAGLPVTIRMNVERDWAHKLAASEQG